jgi:Mrp family chromosome partitioning ATPase
MPRVLEALRKAEVAGSVPEDGPSAPRPYRPEPEEGVADAEEEIPFIEVGGPDTPLEASADVLASTPAGHAAGGCLGGTKGACAADPSAADDAGGRAALATPVPLVRVTFQPFPADVAPARPATERFAPGLVAFHQPEHPVSQQYARLLAALDTQLPAGQPRVVLFTAPAPGAGTSTVVLNLAITRARQAQAAIILVDANLRRPAVAGLLGLASAPGLSDVLLGCTSLRRALRNTGQEHLHVLTAGKPVVNGGPLLGGGAMRSLLHQLRHRGEWVLIDAPCWDGRPEVVALGAACDAVYLVLPQSDAETPESENLMELIGEQGSQLRGCILTQAP